MEILRLIKEEEPPNRAPAERQRLAAAAWRPTGKIEPARLTRPGAGRARLDRHEVPGEGPRPTLRDGQRVGAGYRAVSGR